MCLLSSWHVRDGLGLGSLIVGFILGYAAAQVIEGVAGEEEVADLGRLLGFLDAELAANRNFEFAQALLRLTLQVRWPARSTAPNTGLRGDQDVMVRLEPCTLGFLDAQLAANRSFEFAQALLRLTLQVRWPVRTIAPTTGFRGD